MNTQQTKRIFRLDGTDRLVIPDGEVLYVCSSSGEVRLADRTDKNVSGGADAPRLIQVNDYIVTGINRNPDVIVKVWRIEYINDTNVQSAHGELVSTLGQTNVWKPQLPSGTQLAAQINSFAECVRRDYGPKKRLARPRRR